MKLATLCFLLALAAVLVKADPPGDLANNDARNNNNNNNNGGLGASAVLAGVFENLPISNVFRPTWPVVSAGPAGNVPRIRLPEAFGLDARNDVDWKYFAATLRTSSGDDLDLVAGVTRSAQPPAAGVPFNELIVGLLRMAHVQNSADNFMTVNAGFGSTTNAADPIRSVLTPTPKDYEFSVKMQNCNALKTAPAPIGRDGIDLTFEYVPSQLTDGKAAPVGSIGARYRFYALDRTNNVTIDLQLQDRRGTVFQGDSGSVSTDMGTLSTSGRGDGSLEYSNPRLRIISGTVTFSGRSVHNIVGGNMFLDHQLVIYDLGKPIPTPVLAGPLYVGSWISLWLNDGRSFTFFTAYNNPPAGSYVVYSGSKFPGTVKGSFGTLWAPWTDASQGFTNNIAIKLSGDGDFQVNPLGAPRVDQIELYISPVTGKRFATAMEVKVRRKWTVSSNGVTEPANANDFETFYVKAFQPNGEIYSTNPADTRNSFYESGAYVYDDRRMRASDLVGYGVLEQIGQN